MYILAHSEPDRISDVGYHIPAKGLNPGPFCPDSHRTDETDVLQKCSNKNGFRSNSSVWTANKLLGWVILKGASRITPNPKGGCFQSLANLYLNALYKT